MMLRSAAMVMVLRSAAVVVAVSLSALLGAACVPPGERAVATAPPVGSPTAAQPAGQPAGKPAAAGDAARGKQAYAGTCAGCHGPEGQGLPGLGKDLATSAFVKGLSDQQLVDFVKQGRPASDPANTTRVDMPPRGGNPALTDPQLVDIVAYIRTLAR